MGLGGAMNSGVSGLQAFSNAMSTIGNNLSNANTAGFKASRTLFSDLIPDTVNGSGGTSQIGRGAGLSTVDNIFTQGSIESTSSNLDLAIEGAGFFIVRNPENQTNNYTRAGGFRLDESGYLTNPEGYIAQGYAARGDGGYEDLTSDIQINTRSSVPAQASSEVSLTTNLNAQTDTSASTWNIDDPAGNSDFATTSEVYDSLGNTHLITTYFCKSGTNAWNYYQTVAAEEVSSTGEDVSTDGTIVQVGSGSLGFNDQGLLDELDGSAVDPNSGTSTTTISASYLDWTNTENPPSEDLTYEMNITQFATDSKVVTQQANGYSSGYLNDISVDKEGVITGTYSNGESRGLAKLALGKFANNNGLDKLGKNLFRATNDSGPADVGTPGSGLGSIFSNSLEQSTVDIAEEFTKMITTQRSFQANSKTITTTDEMLNQVINMKR
ncbi:MAG: flagellar hook protein FlgE [Desulfobacteraceae bacterium]|nr:flagellar hook protein FlgE [Desulfobacteraceae bacterium]